MQIKADITESDGKPADGTLTVEINQEAVSTEHEPAPEPPSSPAPPSSPVGEISKVWVKEIVEDVLLNAPEKPSEDDRDVLNYLSHKKLFSMRRRDLLAGVAAGGVVGAPGVAPAVNTAMGTRGTVYLPDEGAKEGDRDSCRRAMASALKKVADGGRVMIPFGKWPMHEIDCPQNKDYVIEGETSLGAELQGSDGRDILIFDDKGTQRRMQNRTIVRNLRFYMPGGESKSKFKRVTELGWRGGAGCMAWRMDSREGDGRKAAWGNSYVQLDNVTAYADKTAKGACLVWSDRPLYAFRGRDIFIGTHSNTQSGMNGIVFGKPPVQLTEATSDEFRLENTVLWGAEMGVCVYNAANAAIVDFKAYACPHSIHLPGYDDKSGNRRRGRDWEIREIYLDCEMARFSSKIPFIHIDVDGAELGTIHAKGERAGSTSPIINLRGECIRGGQFRLMSSSHHAQPVFNVSGDHHDIFIRAAGVPSGHKSKMVNGGRGHAGVTVV